METTTDQQRKQITDLIKQQLPQLGDFDVDWNYPPPVPRALIVPPAWQSSFPSVLRAHALGRPVSTVETCPPPPDSEPTPSPGSTAPRPEDVKIVWIVPRRSFTGPPQHLAVAVSLIDDVVLGLQC